jgi:hypothetical protein
MKQTLTALALAIAVMPFGAVGQNSYTAAELCRGWSTVGMQLAARRDQGMEMTDMMQYLMGEGLTSEQTTRYIFFVWVSGEGKTPSQVYDEMVEVCLRNPNP